MLLYHNCACIPNFMFRGVASFSKGGLKPLAVWYESQYDYIIFILQESFLYKKCLSTKTEFTYTKPYVQGRRQYSFWGFYAPELFV